MAEDLNESIGFEIPVVQTPPDILEGMSAESQSAIFPLIYPDPAYFEFQGTAFCIGSLANGQMIFVTAKHLLNPLHQGLTKDARLLIPHLHQNARGRTLVLALPIDGISISESHNDSALVRCDLRNAEGTELIQVRSVPLTMTRAVVGENTLAIGYSRHLITDEHNFARDFRASHGVIEAVYDKSSDSYLGDFPSFQTNSIYNAGMSGGPVNDEKGRYIGIVSRGVNVSEEVEPWAYATPVATLSELNIELEDDEGGKRDWPFPDLVAAGIVQVTKGTAFGLRHDGSGLSLHWE